MVNYNKIIEYFQNSKIPLNMLERGQLVLNNFLKPMKVLFEQRNIPQKPWNSQQIEFLLETLSNMDTDKDQKAARVGEREARIASSIQLKISGGFCHGIGRSGFLTAPQPKAPGGSIMYDLSNYLATSILKKSELTNIKKAIVAPVSTGMALALCIAALKPDWKGNKSADGKILLPRIDHNSILKSIEFLSIEAKVIEGRIFGDAVRIPFEDIESAYEKDCFGIISTTSFFPPREHDDLKSISKFAEENNLVHIILNAYGVQAPEWMKLIRSSIDAGRVDAIIQSTDKNFLTPVGGSVIASPSENQIDKISKTYPGRASAAPVVNFLISMLSLGAVGYQRLIQRQRESRALLEKLLIELATDIGERTLDVFNPVAKAMTLNHIENKNLFSLGGALYNLRVTGPRVFNPKESSFGTCCINYHSPYITMNSAIGVTSEDIYNAVSRLKKAYTQFLK